MAGNTKRVLSADAVQVVLDVATAAAALADQKAAGADEATNQAINAAAQALAIVGVDINYISYTSSLPAHPGTIGVIGAYFPDGRVQLIESASGGVWNDVGTGVPTLTSSGRINLVGGGIRFPATQIPDTNPNTLDDYEEGTWTPGYVPDSGAFGSINYSVIRSGKYIKIGNVVILKFDMATQGNVALGTASGALRITMPFSLASSFDTDGFVKVYRNFAAAAPNQLALSVSAAGFVNIWDIEANAALNVSVLKLDQTGGGNRISGTVIALLN